MISHLEQILESYETIHSVVQAINNLPYFGGDALEKATLALLLSYGFKDGRKIFESRFMPPNVRNKTAGKNLRTEFNKSIREGRFDIIQQIPEFQEGLWVIDQPMGTSSYPDKILVLYGRVVLIEEKSSTASAFRFNNTPPHPRTFYVFSDKRHNETKIMDAGKFITQYQYDTLIEAQLRGQQAHIDACNKYLSEAGMEDFFIIPGSRPQYLTRGGFTKTDFIAKSKHHGWHLEVAAAINYQLNKGILKYLTGNTFLHKKRELAFYQS